MIYFNIKYKIFPVLGTSIIKKCILLMYTINEVLNRVLNFIK